MKLLFCLDWSDECGQYLSVRSSDVQMRFNGTIPYTPCNDFRTFLITPWVLTFHVMEVMRRQRLMAVSNICDNEECKSNDFITCIRLTRRRSSSSRSIPDDSYSEWRLWTSECLYNALFSFTFQSSFQNHSKHLISSSIPNIKFQKQSTFNFSRLKIITISRFFTSSL